MKQFAYAIDVSKLDFYRVVLSEERCFPEKANEFSVLQSIFLVAGVTRAVIILVHFLALHYFYLTFYFVISQTVLKHYLFALNRYWKL